MPRRRIAFSVALLVLIGGAALSAAVAAQDGALVEGKGWLERIDGYPVLHLKGSPREMGRQHGRLLRSEIRALVQGVFEKAGKDGAVEIEGLRLPLEAAFAFLWNLQREHVPPACIEEMKGLAEGAGLPYPKILYANLIPEFFHCSGFAVFGKATRDGELYHGRVLDYGVDLGLQEHAVLIVQEGEGKIAFCNVSYAGFIGSVSGLNAEGVAVGEMGGGGLGHWKGCPMSFLVRRALEEGASLREAVDVFRKSRRTCEYYYVVSDAEGPAAAGIRATWKDFDVIGPGEAHALLPKPVEDAVILSAGKRYDLLVERIRGAYGTLDEASSIRLMDGPVAMKSNLHDVLFVPGRGVLHVANAAPDGTAAWKQTYRRFDFKALLEKPRPENGEEQFSRSSLPGDR